MKIRKAITKIAAIGIGASMVGATVLSSLAAVDLSQYPKPMFIKDDGTFNGVIIVGDGAAAEDIIGATNIMSSLQAAAVKKVTVNTGGTSKTTVSGESAQVNTDSNHLTIGESLKSVKNNYNDDDLPNLLAKGTYVANGDDSSQQYTYNQKLEFGSAGNATFTHIEDNDYALDPDSPVLAVYSPRNSQFMTYELDFVKDAESDYDSSGSGCGTQYELCDFEDTKITIMGKTYDITKAHFNASGTNDVELDLMGAATTQTLYEGETATYTLNGKDYEVNVLIISDTGTSNPSVIFQVNGKTTKDLTKGQTTTVDGLELGVKEVLGNEAGEEGAGKDMVEFYLGAKKIVLKDSDAFTKDDFPDNLQVGDNDVDDVYADVYMGQSGSKYTLKDIKLRWKPSSDLFVTEKQSETFPGLESFKVEYLGLDASTKEHAVIKSRGNNKIEVNWPFVSGQATFDLLYDSDEDGNFDGYGRASDEQIYTSTPTGAIDTGNWLLVTSQTEEESYLVEFTNVDSSSVVTLKDINGVKYEQGCSSVPCEIDIGDTSVTLDYVDATNDRINVTSGLGSFLFSKQGMVLNVSNYEGGDHAQIFGGNNGTTVNVTIVEEDSNGNVLSGDKVKVTLGFTSDDKTTVKSITGITNSGYSYANQNNPFEIPPGKTSVQWDDIDDSNNQESYTHYGTRWLFHTGGDEDWAELWYPKSEAHGLVYVSAINSKVTTSSGSGVTTEEVVPIPVTASKLASEVPDVTKVNAIVVGGPCVNSAAAKLMGNPTPCTKDFENGKAMIKLYENGDKVALLVAGYSAMDTRRATTVLSEYSKYKADLKGKEVEVTGVGLSSIKVAKPVVATTTTTPTTTTPTEGTA